MNATRILHLILVPLPWCAQIAYGQNPVMSLVGHRDAVQSIAFSADGTRLVSADYNKQLIIWDVSNWKKLTSINCQEPIKAVRLTKKGDLITALLRQVVVWDAATGRKLRIIASHDEIIMALAMTPNGKEEATSSLDGTVRCWNEENGKELRRFNNRAGSLA
jgi:WD40 repeat protein